MRVIPTPHHKELIIFSKITQTATVMFLIGCVPQSNNWLDSNSSGDLLEIADALMDSSDVALYPAPGESDIAVGLVEGSHLLLSESTPLIAVAERDGVVQAVAVYAQEPGELHLSNGDILPVSGAMSASTLTGLMISLADAPGQDGLNVVVFRDSDEIHVGSILDGVEVEPCSGELEVEADKNWCHHWAFCRNDPVNGPSCNAFTGKCNRKKITAELQ